LRSFVHLCLKNNDTSNDMQYGCRQQGRQKRGGWGGPSRPTFRRNICHYSKSS